MLLCNLTNCIDHFRQFRFQLVFGNGELRSIFKHFIWCSPQNPVSHLVTIFPRGGMCQFFIPTDFLQDLEQ